MNLIRKILNAIFDTIYKICELFYNNKKDQKHHKDENDVEKDDLYNNVVHYVKTKDEIEDGCYVKINFLRLYKTSQVLDKFGKWLANHKHNIFIAHHYKERLYTLEQIHSCENDMIIDDPENIWIFHENDLIRVNRYGNLIFLEENENEEEGEDN